MEAVKAFNAELCSLYDLKPPVSKAKMTQITNTAMKAIKFYKHVVQSVEKFIQKCRPEYKVPGLYVIDSIIRQSRRQFGPEKDVFAARFSKNVVITFNNLYGCPSEDLTKIVRVLNLWEKNGVYSAAIVQPLLELSASPHNQLMFERVQKEIESVTGLTPSMPFTRCDQKPPALTADALQLGTSIETKPDGHADLLKVVAQLMQPNPAPQPVLTAQTIQLQLLQQLLAQQMMGPAQPVLENTVVTQLQDLVQQLLGSTANNSQTDHVQQPHQVFNKKLLEFDYGDSDEESNRQMNTVEAAWLNGQDHVVDTKASVSSVASAAAIGCAEHLVDDVDIALDSKIDQHNSETMVCGSNCYGSLVPSTKLGKERSGSEREDEERYVNGSKTAGENEEDITDRDNHLEHFQLQQVPENVQPVVEEQIDDESRNSFHAAKDHEDVEDRQRRDYELSNSSSDNCQIFTESKIILDDDKEDTQEQCSSEDDCIIVESDSSDEHSAKQRRKRWKYSRNSSASHSFSRTPSPRYSRSRSVSRERRHKSHLKRKRKRSGSESVERQQMKKECERRSQGLPPLKESCISICSTTLWIGHLSKQTTEDNLQEELCKYGEATINLIPPRGCAFVCFNTRKEASKALNMLKGIKLLGNVLKVAWAPGVGIKESVFRKLCDIELGVTYIPWEKIPENLDPLLVGGILDEDSVPPDFRVHGDNCKLENDKAEPDVRVAVTQENEIQEHQSDVASFEVSHDRTLIVASSEPSSLGQSLGVPLPQEIMALPQPPPCLTQFSQPFMLPTSHVMSSLIETQSPSLNFGVGCMPSAIGSKFIGTAEMSDVKTLVTNSHNHYDILMQSNISSSSTSDVHISQSSYTSLPAFPFITVQSTVGHTDPVSSQERLSITSRPDVTMEDEHITSGQTESSVAIGLPTFDPTKPPPVFLTGPSKLFYSEGVGLEENFTNSVSANSENQTFITWSNKERIDQQQKTDHSFHDGNVKTLSSTTVNWSLLSDTASNYADSERFRNTSNSVNSNDNKLNNPYKVSCMDELTYQNQLKYEIPKITGFNLPQFSAANTLVAYSQANLNRSFQCLSDSTRTSSMQNAMSDGFDPGTSLETRSQEAFLSQKNNVVNNLSTPDYTALGHFLAGKGCLGTDSFKDTNMVRMSLPNAPISAAGPFTPQPLSCGIISSKMCEVTPGMAAPMFTHTGQPFRFENNEQMQATKQGPERLVPLQPPTIRPLPGGFEQHPSSVGQRFQGSFQQPNNGFPGTALHVPVNEQRPEFFAQRHLQRDIRPCNDLIQKTEQVMSLGIEQLSNTGSSSRTKGPSEMLMGSSGMTHSFSYGPKPDEMANMADRVPKWSPSVTWDHRGETELREPSGMVPMMSPRQMGFQHSNTELEQKQMKSNPLQNPGFSAPGQANLPAISCSDQLPFQMRPMNFDTRLGGQCGLTRPTLSVGDEMKNRFGQPAAEQMLQNNILRPGNANNMHPNLELSRYCESVGNFPPPIRQSQCPVTELKEMTPANCFVNPRQFRPTTFPSQGMGHAVDNRHENVPQQFSATHTFLSPRMITDSYSGPTSATGLHVDANANSRPVENVFMGQSFFGKPRTLFDFGHRTDLNHQLNQGMTRQRLPYEYNEQNLAMKQNRGFTVEPKT